MNNNIIVPSPYQSVSFQQENVPPPNAITEVDLGQQELLNTRKRQAKSYFKTVKRLRSDGDSVTVRDVEAAEDYEDSARALASSPSVLILNQILLRLDAIDHRLDGIDHRLNAIEVRQKNAFAYSPLDEIGTPLLANGALPPLQPTTVGDVLEWSRAQCTSMEEYFNLPPLPNNTVLDVRRKRILKLGYGVSLLKVTVSSDV